MIRGDFIYNHNIQYNNKMNFSYLGKKEEVSIISQNVVNASDDNKTKDTIKLKEDSVNL